MHTLSILIVEKHTDDIILIKKCLEQKKANSDAIEQADTLQCALALLDHYDFDVVLANLFLPDSQGLDTVRRLTKASPHSAIIVIADHEDEALALRCVRFGAQDFIERHNLSPSSLGKSIAYSIERRGIMQSKEDLLNDLTSALEQINKLETILGLCVGCRKIQSDDKEWMDIDEYYQEAIQSHQARKICPDCRAAFTAQYPSPQKDRH